MTSNGYHAVRKVVVIGAGVSGLCALRHFSVDPNYEIVAFEQTPAVGGIWRYPEGCEDHPDAPPTSPHYCRTYRDMMINSPLELTHFPEFPLPPDTPTFVGREVICNYLSDYARHFGLYDYIKFRHQVARVRPIFRRNADPCYPEWEIAVLNLDTNEMNYVTADVLLLCNGHNGKPYKPVLHGIENFRGPVIHSSEYRVPERFSNQSVLVVGGMVSANDISCQLLPVAKKIILSRRVYQEPVYQRKYSHVVETTTVKDFTENSVILQNGVEEQVDAVILCTGFDYDFPFLTEDCRTNVSRGRVSPLYRHFIHCEFHTLAFVGLLNVVPFLVAGAEPQIKYYKAFLDGKFRLPSVDEMMADAEDEYNKRLARGFQPHYAHKMIQQVWPYIDQMANEGGFQSYRPNAPSMYKDNVEAIVKIPYDFRSYLDEKYRADREGREAPRRKSMMPQEPLRRMSIRVEPEQVRRQSIAPTEDQEMPRRGSFMQNQGRRQSVAPTEDQVMPRRGSFMQIQEPLRRQSIRE